MGSPIVKGKYWDVGIAALAGAVGFAAVALLSLPGSGSSAFSNMLANLDSACNIKGNVSIYSGERIYHIPGQRYYVETSIRTEYGERWFCSEAEARAAGWRRAGH